MRKTTNYELNIADGSDKYNHLTIDNPNYEKIDAIMKENEDGAVQTATELKSGTVHAITRSKPNASMFRFVATSDYSVGETFTVDGKQVTALLPNGGTLSTGAYHINANVLCCLVGTNMTVYTNGTTDASTLEGHSADYFATADDLTKTTVLAQDAQIVANSVNTKLSSLGLKLVKIWSNPNPNEDIVSKNFNISYGSVPDVGILTYRYYSNSVYVGSALFVKNIDFPILMVGNNASAQRSCNISNNAINVDRIYVSGAGLGNSSLIPVDAYGIVPK